MPPIPAAFYMCNYLLSLVLSHFWFAIPQLVLQADWQEVWHSPQPPFFALSHRLRVSIVLICSMIFTFHIEFYMLSLAYSRRDVNIFFSSSSVHFRFCATTRNRWVIASRYPCFSSNSCAWNRFSLWVSTEKSGNSQEITRANQVSAPTS